MVKAWNFIALVAQSRLTLCDPMDLPHQAPLPMVFLRQEYWSGLPFPSPGDLPDPGIKLNSPAQQVGSLPLSHQETLKCMYILPQEFLNRLLLNNLFN